MYRDGHTCEDCLRGSVFNAFKNRCYDGSLFKSGLLTAEAIYQSLANNYQALDVIVSPSQFLANIIKQKLPNSRIDVIVNGIDENVDMTNTSDEGYFLFLGRLSKEKGVETMAKAYQLCSQSMPLKVAGVGPLTEELTEHYPNVELLGFQSGESLHKLIREASAIIVPSECYENCSMSVLEAMAYGKPIIGANIGGIPEQVRDNVEGRLFEAGNPESLAQVMDEMAQSSSERHALGKFARKRLVDTYSLTSHHQKLISLYKELLGQ
jgi:glycosyltransferase involved in cell wall biosynthesis